MSKIKIYRTNISPQRNALVDDIESYLTHCPVTYSNDEFQYIKVGLDVRGIKVPMAQSNLTNQTVGNYMRVEQDNKVWYFFILNAMWRGQNVIELDLSIDSINTFRNDFEWSDKTIIQREHRNRLVPIGINDPAPGNPTFLRLIDRDSEGIIPNKIRNSYKQLKDKDHDQDYYLIYRTRDDLTTDDIANPVDCFLLADNPLKITESGGIPGPKTYNIKDIISLKRGGYKHCYFAYPDSPNGEFKLGDSTFKTQDTVIYDLCYTNDGSGPFYPALFALNYEKAEGTQVYRFINREKITIAPTGTITIVNMRNGLLTKEEGTLLEGAITDYNEILALHDKYIFNIGTHRAISTIPFSEFDRTDSRVMKVVDLPYAPVNITYNGDVVIFPDNWHYDNGMMKLDIQTNTEFLNEKFISFDVPQLIATATAQPGPHDNKQKTLESKLYHSDFYTFKIAYDSFSKTIPLEYMAVIGLAFHPTNWPKKFRPSLDVSFKATNTINSKFAFKIADHIEEISRPAPSRPGAILTSEDILTEDYGEYLVIARNNEVPTYSNSYVDYIRNGYNFDVKNHSLQMAGNAAGIVAGAASGVGSAATLLGGGKIGGGLGAIAGGAGFISAGAKAIGSIANAVIDNLQFENQMNGKLQQLSSQASNVAGSDDIDLLKFYNGNRLNIITYYLDSHDSNALYDLFFYTGYSHNRREVPNTTSRYWFNFIQCVPVFKNELYSPFADYLDDIKNRYSKGVTVYHRHGAEWDWEQEFENWETTILSD